MKKVVKLVLLSALALSLFACNSGSGANGEKNASKKPKVEISIKDFGVMQAELEPEIAPITVANFLKLVNDGFYNGLTIHRVVTDFMIQGGDPTGNGDGGTGETIKGEFESNGVPNSISHERGVISMARWGDEPDSASSQFFILQQDAVRHNEDGTPKTDENGKPENFLDGEYAAFGRIVSGIEIVDKICEEVKPIDELGTVDKMDQPVIEYIKVIE
ncbi:MAG: peptidylprolyl isomerase [Lachnospiraceae bacterium]|nr:peptidylprolyl isomerase [Lachnospiraceae bacterium]